MLSEKIQMLLNDDGVVQKIADNAVSFLKSDCNEKIMAKEIEGFLSEYTKYGK